MGLVLFALYCFLNYLSAFFFSSNGISALRGRYSLAGVTALILLIVVLFTRKDYLHKDLPKINLRLNSRLYRTNTSNKREFTLREGKGAGFETFEQCFARAQTQDLEDL